MTCCTFGLSGGVEEATGIGVIWGATGTSSAADMLDGKWMWAPEMVHLQMKAKKGELWSLRRLTATNSPGFLRDWSR
jgi:hypothetical protein